MSNKLDKMFDDICEGLKKSDITFAKNLFGEVCLLSLSTASHTIPIARIIANVIEYKPNEKELAQVIVKIYKDNYKKILQLVNLKADPEAEALARIAVLVVNHGHICKECEIRVVARA